MMDIENQYNITIEKDNDEKVFIRVKSLGKGGHHAKHRNYIEVDDTGLETSRSLTEISAPLVLANIKKKGITEGFYLRSEPKAVKIIVQAAAHSKSEAIKPNDVRHFKTQAENSFTSTGSKLGHHWPIFQKLKETGYGSIIRATMTLHQVCASKCQFCSTISRNKTDSISLEEAKQFVRELYFDQAVFNQINHHKYNDRYKLVAGTDIRLKGLILSGGGQPNLWPHFSEFVEWLAGLDIDLGLITNGFPKHVADEIYKKFKWIRLSVTPEEASPFYKDGKFNLQRIPESILKNKDQAFGLSYVYGPWTTDEILQRIASTADEWGCEYVRLLADCNLGRSMQLRAHKSLAERLFKMGFIKENGEPTSKIFHQLKYHGTSAEGRELWQDGKCFLQAYNVFWDTTGHEDNGVSWCYPCDSVTVLQDDESKLNSARGFDGGTWGTVNNKQVKDLYEKPWRAFFDPRDKCNACLFMNNNKTVKHLMSISSDGEHHSSSVEIKHVNFP